MPALFHRAAIIIAVNCEDVLGIIMIIIIIIIIIVSLLLSLFIMAALRSICGHHIFALWFLSSSSFFLA